MATVLERFELSVAEAKLDGRDSWGLIREAHELSADLYTLDAQAIAARGHVLRRYNEKRERYVELLLQTAEHLAEVAKRIAADPACVPNSLGELQSRTSEIEGTGATLNALREVLELGKHRIS